MRGWVLSLISSTAPISTIRSHAPSLVVSVSKIISRPTGVGTTKGWFFWRILAITTSFLCYLTFRIKRVQRISLRRLPRPKPEVSHNKLEERKLSRILEDFESFSSRSVSRALSIPKRYDRMEDDVTKRFTRKCSLKFILSSPIRYNHGSEKCCSKMKNSRSEEKLEKEDAFYSC